MRYFPLVLLGLLAPAVSALAQTAPTDSASLVAIDTMKRDLRAYLVAQERHFVPNETYATSLAPLEFTRDSSVVIKIASSSAEGHSAVATHPRAPRIECAIWVGNATPPLKDGSREGIPTCRTS